MRKFLSLFAAVLVALVANAAVINITNANADALRLALNSAQTGDIIEMAAGTYVESNSNYIAFAGKEVTVRAAEGAEVLIQPKVSVTLSEGAKARFENIKFDVSHLIELASWYEHLIYPTDATENRLELEGCEFYGFNLNKSMIYCSSSNKLSAITINNCYFHDCMKSLIFVESTADMNAQIKNSTFANISTNTESYWAGVIDIRATGATLLVDHCTFYNVIPMNTDYSCVSKVTLANGVASNCIFMLPTAQDGIRAMRGVTANNCITFNYLNDSGTGIHSSVTKNNCVQVDPLFVDAANGDFTLGEGSPALTMNDGQPIGDPRWIPSAEPVVEPELKTKTLYCKVAQDWWKADGAAVGVYAYGEAGAQNAAWPGVRMTAVEGAADTWTADIDVDLYHTVIFTRVNASGDIADWGAKTADLTIPTDDNDLYTITSAEAVWGNPGVAGEWSKYAASEPVTPTLENGFYLIGKINGVEGWNAADLSADRKFAANPENPAEFVLTATLAEGDEIKVVNVLNDAITAWYPDGMGNDYTVDAAHAGAKTIYFQPDYKADWSAFGGYFYIAANEEPQPAEVDFTKPFTLLFNGTGVSGTDNTNAYAAEVDAIFTAETKGYVASVETAERVYAGRPIADDNSSLKFGTSSVKGKLAFTLAQEIEVDSIIVNATQYSGTAAEVTVNDVKFDLTAGNKVPTDCKITPEGAISAITIAQTGSQRIYLRYVKVYPKQAGEEPVVEPEVTLPVVAIAGTMNEWSAEANVMVAAEDSLSASVTIALEAQKYEFKVVSDGKWLSLNGEGETLYGIHREWNEVAHINGIDLRNFELTADVEGEYTFTWTYADSTLLVAFPEKPEEPVVETPNFYIAGTMTDWATNMIAVTGTSYQLNLEAGEHKLKVVVGEGEAAQWLGYDALTTIAEGLTDDEDGNICFTLTEAGEVNVHYDGEFFFLNGDFYVAPVEAGNYYIKNSWGTSEWSWKAMTLDEEGTYYHLANVVVSGDGINFNSAASDKNAAWITWDQIGAFDASYNEAVVGALDTVVFFFDPEMVDSYAGENGISALILGKYVAPVEPQGCDWENIEFLGGPAENANQFKVCKPENVGVVNIQNPNWSEKTQMGIYMTFPSAAFGEISLDEALYEKQGAGILFFLSAFTAQETEFVVNCDGNDLVITVYNAKAEEPVAEHTYTVAGDNLTAFGTTWDPTNTVNDMEMNDDGIYVWEKAELTLAAGTVQFKVTEDHAWAVAYPASDYQLVIPEAGIYNIWIHFDPTNDNQVTAEATKTGSAVVIPTIAMHGNFTGSWVDTENFTVAEGNETASLTLDLAAGNYEFGMRIGGPANWTANGVAFTLENNSAVVVAGSGNLTLAANIEGEYTFTWTFATSTLSIEFPEGEIVEPTLDNGYYVIGLNGWEVTDLTENDMLWSTGIETGEYSIETTLAVNDAFKVVQVVNDAIVAWFPEGADNNYVVDQNHAGTTTIYFRPGYNGNEDWHEGCIFVTPTGTVGIDAVDANAPAVKVLRNGQILIKKGDKTYNVMGAIVR